MDVENCNDLSLAKRNLLLYSANESDVKFVFTLASNLEVFLYAHKRILSIGSCVFDQMFNGIMAATESANDDFVYITDISLECFKNVLTFIYIDAAELTRTNIMEVMYAAHKYQICKLESMCCDFLYKNMDISNVMEIHEMTLMYSNNITKQCLQWIDDLFDDLSKWKNFMNLRKATLMELLKRDTLNISELNLFKAVYKWAENQCCGASIEPSDANVRTVADNFKDIRFPTMTFEEFAECTRYGMNILTAEEKVDVWDALAKVKRSEHFNSTKRTPSAMSYKAFMFSYSTARYNETGVYSFVFQVSRIVHVTYVTVIRNCILTIYEQEFGETRFTKGKEYPLQFNKTNKLNCSFVPNVKYVLATSESFQNGQRNSLGRLHCNGESVEPANFKSYREMIQYYNRVTVVSSWNFTEQDPFLFDIPQKSLIRVMSYKTRNVRT